MTHLDHFESVVGAQHAAPLLGRISSIQGLLVSAAALFACLLVAASVLGDCKCGPPDKGETTRWGGNEMVVVKEENSFRKLEGRVQMSGDRPLENALVEIFDHPDYLLDTSHSRSEGPPEQKRLAACRTAKDGKFCFRNLPPGKYELRSSMGSGWNVTHVYVVLDGQSKRNGKLKVLMLLGT
jgi:hypothetical protein